MRRVLMALVGTAVGTTLLVGLKATGATPGPLTVAPAPLDPAGTAGTSPLPGQPGHTAAPTLHAPGPTPGQTPNPHASSPTGAPPTTRTITGAAINVANATSPNPTRGCGGCHYQMQVTIQVVGAQISAISAAHLSVISGDNLSCYTKAVNTLIQRAPTGYPTNTAVSGATYSANAYLQSLQDAINHI